MHRSTLSFIALLTVLLQSKPLLPAAEPLRITEQPRNLRLEIGKAGEFSVGVAGTPVAYRWQKGNQFISGATGAVYRIPSAATSSSGSYRVIVTNLVTSLTSSVALLQVTADRTGPHLLQALGETNTFPGRTVLAVTFDSAVLAGTATNTDNYALYAEMGFNRRLAITNAAIVGGKVILFPSSEDWVFGRNYVLVANFVADVSTNLINPNSIIGVEWGFPVELARINEQWSFYDSAYFDSSFPSIYRSTAWTTEGFVEDAFLWGSGTGPFFRMAVPPESFCSGIVPGTEISSQNWPTLYRRTIALDTNSVGLNLSERMQMIITNLSNSGFVLYLNSQEAYRTPSMQGVAALAETSTGSFGDVLGCSSRSFFVTNVLRQGSNQVAVAVYRPNPSSGETVFGLGITVVFSKISTVPEVLPGPYSLNVVQAGSGSIVSWPSNWYGMQLQTTTNLAPDPNFGVIWDPVKDQSNPYTNAPTGNAAESGRFFRLVRP